MKHLAKILPLLSIIIALNVKTLQLSAQGKQMVSAAELKEWVSYLASDEMLGRANGSPQMETAAQWIVKKFIEYNVKPGFGNNGYIQSYSYTSRQNTISERNVIGVIEGSDPSLRNEFIILSAHFDHIGIRRGASPDSIFNGADDNAAGTSTLIGIARSIMLSGAKPGRTLVFAAFSGEENGMRGSRYYVANPSVPLNRVYADINFEMIGHSELLGKNNYYMTGCLMSNLDDLIGEYARNTQCKLIDTVALSHRLFGSSDNIAFSRISVSDGITTGIPSGTFATSTMAPHVHNVTDEVKLFDFDNMANLVNHFTGMVIWLSNSREQLNWTDPGYRRLK